MADGFERLFLIFGIIVCNGSYGSDHSKTGKEEIKMSPFAGDVILFIENSEDFPGPKKQKSIRTNK